ncbi:recombinase family protein [Ruminococcus sp.]|nr:recombinase family protein [Ruminococcus sp.]
MNNHNTSFPEMKRKTNRGERRQYYAVGSHPAIISKEIFEAVQ